MMANQQKILIDQLVHSWGISLEIIAIMAIIGGPS
jgi:hypothetical protein